MIHATGPVISADVAGHYDDFDPFYRALWGEHVHHGYWETGLETPSAAAEALIDRLAARLGIEPGASVCDIGCGYGATALHLAQLYWADVTGVTLSPVQAARAAALTAESPGFEICCGDWLRNDLPSERFDAAIAIESTEHMPDKPCAFAEAFRVLRPGGRLGVCAWLAAEAPSEWQTRFLLEPICREGRMPAMGTRSEYLALASAAGFEDVAIEDASAAVRRTWTICARRFARAVATDRRLRAYLRDPQARNRVFR